MGYFFRLLIIAVAVWLAVQLLRRLLGGPRASQASDSTRAAPPRMLPCAYCGVHVPENQAVMRGGRAYCSAEHLALEERSP